MATELVSKENLLKAVVALRECCKKIDNKRLFNSDKLFIQLAVKKIINEPQKLHKIVLPHTPIDVKSSDICLFVKDVDKKSRDYEKTISAYKDLFKEQGIDTKIDIFPMKKLKIEFNDYEAKRHLANLYDVFLCDSRIIRLMPAILGKHFYGKKKFPHQVRLAKVNIKGELEKCLKTSMYDVKNRGASCQALFGGLHSTDAELVENLQTMISAFIKSTPGGEKNVRIVCIKSERSVAVPIYVSYGDKSEVKLDDKVKLPTGKPDGLYIDCLENPSDLLLEQAEEVSTVTNGLVVVTDDGEVLIVGDDGDVINCGDDDVRDGCGDDDNVVMDGDDDDVRDDDDDDDEGVVDDSVEVSKRIIKMKNKGNRRDGDDDDDDDMVVDDDDMDDREMGKVGGKRKRTNSNNKNKNNIDIKNKDNKKIKLSTEDNKKKNNNKNNKRQQPKSVNIKNTKNSNNNKIDNNNNKGEEGTKGERSKRVKRVVIGKGNDDLKFFGRRV